MEWSKVFILMNFLFYFIVNNVSLIEKFFVVYNVVFDCFDGRSKI